MKKLATYYVDGKIKYNKKNGLYYYQDNDKYLFAQGIYKTKIKEEDLPDYYIKVWLHPKYIYLSLKGIKDVSYRPNFHNNHYRKYDALYISYNNKLIINQDGYCNNYDIMIWGPEINHIVKELEKCKYKPAKMRKIKNLMDKKNKWYKYWDDRNWNGNYFFTSEEVWNEILGDEK